ncbi:MAG: nucleotidyltransferase substrate binding protein [Myxococcaceae bacterium]
MDIRWKQRFQNYQDALSKLEEAVLLSQERPLSELEQQGLIQAFEFTHELAWNTMKDFFGDQGPPTTIMGSRDATRQAFKTGLIEDGEAWMDMIKSRNLSSHTYHREVANDIASRITRSYFQQFKALEKRFEGFE